MRYCTRRWLSPRTHSSAYVMCYYNLNCLNKTFCLFIRIADCERSFVFDVYYENVRTAISVINKIISVVEGKKSRVTISNGSCLFTFYKKEKYGDDNKYICGFGIYRHYTKDAIEAHPTLSGKTHLIRLHADDETCSVAEWNRKMKILSTELKKFVSFLEGIKK